MPSNEQPIRFRHRDLEVRNIMIKGEAISAVIDWGLASFYLEAGFWTDPEFLGQDDYMLGPILDYIDEHKTADMDLTRLHN
ncbi:hypothetical protein BGX27_000593 [Mortierella sp. AM989]|nr:hypothetical protein BGX27_000593 [Mortierella sp. AM989]